MSLIIIKFQRLKIIIFQKLLNGGFMLNKQIISEGKTKYILRGPGPNTVLLYCNVFKKY